MSKFLLAVGAIPLLLYCSLLLFMYWFQERLIFVPTRLSSDFTFNFRLPFEEHSVEVGDATLNVLCFHKSNAEGTIIYFHGNAGALNTWGDVAYDFERFPYNLVVFDYRGYGKSTGVVSSEEQLRIDAERIYNFVDERFGSGKRVIVGRSLGTGIASWLATRYPPEILVLETPYETLPDLVKIIYPFVPRLLVKYELANRKWIQDVSYPVHLIHGDRDDLIPHRCSEKLANLGNHIHLHIIRDAAHNNITEFSRYHVVLDRVFASIP